MKQIRDLWIVTEDNSIDGLELEGVTSIITIVNGIRIAVPLMATDKEGLHDIERQVDALSKTIKQPIFIRHFKLVEDNFDWGPHDPIGGA